MEMGNNLLVSVALLREFSWWNVSDDCPFDIELMKPKFHVPLFLWSDTAFISSEGRQC